jgi:carboxyl-terminal processing protease
MNTRLTGRNTLVAVAGLALSLLAGSLNAQPPAAPPAPTPPAAAAPAAVEQTLTLSELSTRIWNDAHKGDAADLNALLKSFPGGDSAELTALRANAASLEKNLAKREELRNKKLAELSKKFDEQLAKEGPDALSESLKLAVETYLVLDRPARAGFKHEPRIVTLIKNAETAAHKAEARGDWFKANELFYRAHLLLEEEGTYKQDSKRLGMRLNMIRLYAPETFWKLRNDERMKENEKSEKKKPPLPPYNGLGENFREKLNSIDAGMVIRAVNTASRQQIDRVTLKDEMLGGIEQLRTLITTTDLKSAFPALADKAKVDEFAKFLDDWTERLNTPGMIATVKALADFTDEALASSRKTIELGDGIVLHEFGSGAMGKLDDFSAIIWPDELARFNRMTEGQFRGVGVQIQMDDESQMIKVVTPLEGTPAQRAGIRTGDLIKKINGESAVGISLNQAVDLITGPVDTTVTMTMERKSEKTDDSGKDVTQDIDFKLARAVIPIDSVKGWRRTGAKETDWDWFIDAQSHIGYIRLLQFTDETTRDLRNAIHSMQARGPLGGLILDLRFNPGGLLTEAVGVSNTFIDKGTIVSTEGTVQGEVKTATPGESMLKGAPLVVLINEGSASASEIVSGAIRYYADKGDIKAVLIGERSYGKGSVQNVWPLSANAKMKLTTQYYKIPDGRIIHRKPGASVWGIDPHLAIDMLPETESDALKMRQDVDVLPIDDKGQVVLNPKTPRPDPNKLLEDGLDVQLQTALAILQAQAAAQPAQARVP